MLKKKSKIPSATTKKAIRTVLKEKIYYIGFESSGSLWSRYNDNIFGHGFARYNAKNKRVGTFYGCREQFHRSESLSNGHIVYSPKNMPKGGIQKLGKFIFLVEEKLKIKDKTSLYRVHYKTRHGAVRKNVVLIKLSKFWINRGPTIKSLFTILLRAGIAHTNIETAVNNQPYLKQTKIAVHRFLSGYTHCKSGAGLWVSAMSSGFFCRGSRVNWRRLNDVYLDQNDVANLNLKKIKKRRSRTK